MVRVLLKGSQGQLKDDDRLQGYAGSYRVAQGERGSTSAVAPHPCPRSDRPILTIPTPLLCQRHYVCRNALQKPCQPHLRTFQTSTSTTMAAEMKQWQTGQDGLDKLTLTTAKVPEPKDGEVLVKINAVSLNYRDTEGTDTSPRLYDLR